MTATNKQIRQAGFAKRLKERLDKEDPKYASLSTKDLTLILDLAFDEISVLLKEGFRVIFEGHFSFFTKAIKRKCSNLHTKEAWMTYKNRLRWTPAPKMKERTEVEITEEEWLNKKR